MVLIVQIDQVKNVVNVIAGHMLAIESGVRRYDADGKEQDPVRGENMYTYQGVTFNITPHLGHILFILRDGDDMSHVHMKSIMDKVGVIIQTMDNVHVTDERPRGIGLNSDHSAVMVKPPFSSLNYINQYTKAFRRIIPEMEPAYNSYAVDSNVIFKWFYSTASYLRIENFAPTPLSYLHMAPSTIIVDCGELTLPNGHRALNYPTIQNYRLNDKWMYPKSIAIDVSSMKPMGREIASIYGIDVPFKQMRPVNISIQWNSVQFLRRVKGRKINEQIDMPFDFETQEAEHAQDVLDGKPDKLTCFISGIPLYGLIYAVEILEMNNVDEEKRESWPTILVDSVVVEYANKQLDALAARYKIKTRVTKCPITVKDALPIDMDPRHHKIVSDIAKFGAVLINSLSMNQPVMCVINPVERTVCIGCRHIALEQLRARTNRCMIMFKYE